MPDVTAVTVETAVHAVLHLTAVTAVTGVSTVSWAGDDHLINASVSHWMRSGWKARNRWEGMEWLLSTSCFPPFLPLLLSPSPRILIIPHPLARELMFAHSGLPVERPYVLP